MVNRALWDIEKKMQKSIELLKRDLATIRTGRATPALIEHLKVAYSGVPPPLHPLTSISSPGAGPPALQPWVRGRLHCIDHARLYS